MSIIYHFPPILVYFVCKKLVLVVTTRIVPESAFWASTINSPFIFIFPVSYSGTLLKFWAQNAHPLYCY